MILTPFQELTLLSLLLAFISVLPYKFLVDIKAFKAAKADIDFYRKKMEEAQKAKKTDEVNKFLDEMMKANKRYLSFTTKPLVISVLIFFIAFGFLSSLYGISSFMVFHNFGGIQAQIGENKTIGGMEGYPVRLEYRGNAYDSILFKDNGTYSIIIDANSDGAFSEEKKAAGEAVKLDSSSWAFEVINNRTVFMQMHAYNPVIPYVGQNIHWFGWYFLLVIPANMFFRKLLGID
ncbi:MAG: hypothetical protein HYX24_03310 [Candidatus Aenigmarchaeota archaeon]|nr:hypothetical protein [Candidatus Aenigmarchaeota archaeon]